MHHDGRKRPFFPQTHTLVQIMTMIQVMIDYNCYHCHKDDCLGGKVPGFGETQRRFCIVLVV